MTSVNLSNVDETEFQTFFDSITTVLFDLDGVLFRGNATIPGAAESISWLIAANKNVKFVTNNATVPIASLINKINKLGCEICDDDIVNPASAVIHFFKKKNFNKKVYVIGMSALKYELTTAGFQVAEDGDMAIKETFADIVNVMVDDEDIGAVIFDFDVNFCYAKMLRAMTYLKRPDVFYILGGSDKKLPFTTGLIPGLSTLQKDLEEITQNTAVRLAKPSYEFGEYAIEKFNISDRNNVLFVGDALLEDMGFAIRNGFKSLLVLSGNTTLEDLEKGDISPSYYINSIGDLPTLAKNKL